MGQSVLRDRRNPFRSETSAQTQKHAGLSRCRPKGNGVNIPQPGHGDRSFGPRCGNATESEGVDGGARGKSYLFFVRVRVPGIGSSEIGTLFS
ncbi:hypothetical protein JTE90_000028 [Oedothorax gibbosus]|uniref:Uncharacterized protein n=1 Tax=Oedothorax gibbosus TaxID=931172 RepID=A0AAV6TD71_9ARAC|nr:hypothetical protein JTE90_000028 [Oedothorax gibbosus]